MRERRDPEGGEPLPIVDPACRPKRVVIIAVDAVRYDYIPRFQPSNVEALVRRGVGFRNAVTANCIAETGPGFACLSTGVYVKRHGICTSRHRFDKSTRAARYSYDEATGHVQLDAPTLTEM